MAIPERRRSNGKHSAARGEVARTDGVSRRSFHPLSHASAERVESFDAGRGAASPQQLFENQEIVLTVPASFDEEARELTVEAARQAGLQTLTLLEEPLAAFYAWVAAHQKDVGEHLRDGDLVLICDIGGGTSDFSLVRAQVKGLNIQFERTAIGDHLLLGGESLDLALANRVEQKLKKKLSLRQRHGLRIACSVAKERLLTEENIDRLPISVLGGGRSVVGHMLSSELTRDEVTDAITGGFLPLTGPDQMPLRTRVAGLREIGLPYATDPAITKHLAAFLKRAAMAMGAESGSPSQLNDRPLLARPDAVLFNGGFCIPKSLASELPRPSSIGLATGLAAPEDSEKRRHEQRRRHWSGLLRPGEAGNGTPHQGWKRQDTLRWNTFGTRHQGGVCNAGRHERGNDLTALGS